MRFIRYAALILAVVGWTMPLRAEVTVGAAISLKQVLEGARGDLEKAAGDKIAFTFGASGTIAGQVRQGAPIDLFISADRANVDKLVEAKAADKATVTVVATNVLCLVRPKKAAGAAAEIAGFGDLTKSVVRRIAIGEPKVVPAGEYARQTLVALKLWDELQKTQKLVTTENVAQALTLVERGEVDAGIVYRTDALASRECILVAQADPALHAPIEYVSVLVTGSKQTEAAMQLQKAMGGKLFVEALEKAGFSKPTATAQPATNPAAK